MVAQGKGGVEDKHERASDRRRGQAASPDLLENAGGEGPPCGSHGSHRPDLEISMGEFAWHGYRGLEDHQMGSKDQFFDQHFEPRNISVELAGEEATVK
jgi:hypothetical protein